MMRISAVAAVVIAIVSALPAQAGEGPWCAFISLGTGNVYEDCQYYSFVSRTCWPAIGAFAT